MPVLIADRCAVCGRTVVKPLHYNSSGMVVTKVDLLYLGDPLEGSKARMSLTLPEAERYCPACLKQVLCDWLDSLEPWKEEIK